MQKTIEYTPRQKAAKAVTEATENYAYWTRQAAIRTHPPSAALAAGLASTWKKNLHDRREKLAALSLAPPRFRD